MPISFESLVELNEVDYAQGRQVDRVYVSRSFIAAFGADEGYPSRYIYKVFDECEEKEDDQHKWEWTNYVVDTTPGSRKQIRLQVAREAGAVREIKIQRVPTALGSDKLETMLTLDRSQSNRFIDLIRALDSIPPEGDSSVRVDDQMLRDIFSDPEALGRAYAEDPSDSGISYAQMRQPVPSVT